MDISYQIGLLSPFRYLSSRSHIRSAMGMAAFVESSCFFILGQGAIQGYCENKYNCIKISIQTCFLFKLLNN
jgi:hypothetical protein